MKPIRGWQALRTGCFSSPNTSYFITICTDRRAPGLTRPSTAEAVKDELIECESASYWAVRGAVIMPDHVHLLVRLGCKLALSKIIARLKSQTRSQLARSAARWQRNYYEHRLRPDEPVDAVLRYLFLNPYRANLVAHEAVYPWFWLGLEESAWFQPPDPSLSDNILDSVELGGRM